MDCATKTGSRQREKAGRLIRKTSAWLPCTGGLGKGKGDKKHEKEHHHRTKAPYRRAKGQSTSSVVHQVAHGQVCVTVRTRGIVLAKKSSAGIVFWNGGSVRCPSLLYSEHIIAAVYRASEQACLRSIKKIWGLFTGPLTWYLRSKGFFPETCAFRCWNVSTVEMGRACVECSGDTLLHNRQAHC